MRYQNWEIRDFSRGYMDKLDDNLLPENASSNCQNFIARQVGSLKKRPGQERLQDNGIDMTALGGPILGLYAYYFSEYGDPVIERRFVIAANGNVYSWDGSLTLLNSGLDTTQDIFFETCANYMVAFSGLDTPWKWDGTNVTTLANAPVDGRWPVLHKEKLFVVPVTDPSTLHWSETFAPEDWPQVNFWPIKDGDGDFITNLQVFLGELIIFKGRSIHSLRGSSLNDFRLDEIDSALGCVGPRAAAAHKNQIYFVSSQGLYMFNGMKSYSISNEAMPNLWEKVDKEHLDQAVVGVWDELVWFSLPVEGDQNNLVIVYEPKEESLGTLWPWKGIKATCMAGFDDGLSHKLYTGGYDGYVNQQYTGTEDFGSAVTAYWEGPAFDGGQGAFEKKSRKAFVEDSPDTDNVVDLQISTDGQDFNSLTYRTNDRLLREYSFNSGVQWRRIKIKVIHDEAGECEVRGITIPFRSKHRPRVKEAK